MTLSSSIVLVLLIGLYSTGNNINLANNTSVLLTLLIALIALSFSTNKRRCMNNFQTSSLNNNFDIIDYLN